MPRNPKSWAVLLIAIFLSGVLLLNSYSPASPEEKANAALVENLLKLGCESWVKSPIDTNELSSKFAAAANAYNEFNEDNKYDPLASAAINWHFIEVTSEMAAGDLALKNLAGFTIIEFCKSGKIIDYENA